MATSHHTYISDVIGWVRRLQPDSILDVGIGFGKWGHLFREYLDVMYRRVDPGDWQLHLDGVEVFEPYVQEHQRHVYSNIYISDIATFEYPQHYSLIFGSDVLEHIEREPAEQALSGFKEHADNVLLMVPLGSAWYHSQAEMNGNAREAHVSCWELRDLEDVEFRQLETYTCNRKPIGMFLYTGAHRQQVI